ncbi:MAG: hypothetical protein EBY62_07945 [Cellvibrionales bacterium]|nr:hypothetical protein [Cellvibrionales bacterium]
MKEISWPDSNQASYNLQNLYAPYKTCPIDFGSEFGMGFLHATYRWDGVFDDPKDGEVSSIATVRELRAADKALLNLE